MAGSRWRAWVEAHLPWYHPHTERLRNVRSQVIDRHAVEQLGQAKQIIDDYRAADQVVRREH